MTLAARCTSSSNFLIILGVNARDTIRRSRACRGSSMLIIEPKYSLNSGRQVEDARRPGGGGEQLRVPARLSHVDVPDQGVVAALRHAERRLARLEERRRVQRPQPRVRGVPLRRRQRPEGVIRQVDVADEGLGHGCGPPSELLRPSSPIVTAARQKRERATRRATGNMRLTDRLSHPGTGSSATGGSVPAMAIARYPSFVIDCPDPAAMAAFYAALLDWEPDVRDDWANVRPADGSNCISFQQVKDYTPPEWPAQQVPQQMHLDVVVDDLGTRGGGGARARRGQARVPAGHDLPRLPRPGGPPVLPLRGVTPLRPGTRPVPGSPMRALGGKRRRMAT